MNDREALAYLDSMIGAPGAPTLHINRQLLRQALEPIRASLASRLAPSGAGEVSAESFAHTICDVVNDSDSADFDGIVPTLAMLIQADRAAVSQAAELRGRRAVLEEIRAEAVANDKRNEDFEYLLAAAFKAAEAKYGKEPT